MMENVKHWVDRLSSLQDCHDDIDFQTDVMADWNADTGYSSDSTKARELLHQWENDKDDDVVTYRDKCFASIFTGAMSPSYGVSWWQAFDDSIETFVK